MTGLEKLRLDRLMMVEDLAREVGVAAGTIRNIEKGNPTTVKTLARLSSYFGVPASSLVQSAPVADLDTAA